MTQKLLYPILLLFLGALYLGGCSAESRDRDQVTDSIGNNNYSPDFYQEWHQAAKIDFASMTVTKTISTERTAWYKIGDRIAVYSFDVYLRAYIDMDKLQPADISIDEDRKIITVSLPPVESEIIGRSSDLKEVYTDIGLFRTRPDSRERAELKEKANEDFRKEFAANPTYRTQLEAAALRKAHSYFESLGNAAGYKVEFSSSLPIYRNKD